MVNNVKSTLLRLCLLSFLTVVSSFHAYAHNGQNHQAAGEDTSLNSALHWLELSQDTSGAVINPADIATGFQSTSEALTVFTLLNSSIANQTTALELIKAAPQAITTGGLVRLIIALKEQSQPFTTQQAELLSRQNEDGGFGEFEGYGSTAIDTALALFALQKIDADTLVAGKALSFLSASQLTDGSFAVYAEKGSSIVTAMVLQSIRNYLYTYNVSDMLTRSIDFLYGTENINGGWGSYWETAIILQALIPVTTDVTRYQKALDYLKAGQSVDGDWNQRVYSTALAAATLKLSTSIEVPVDPEKAVVTGKITDLNGVTISGASVDVLGITTEVIDIQPDGTFTVSNLDPDSYVLAYSASGYLGASQNITLQKGQFANVGTVKLSIVPTGTLLSGVVIDATSNTPISGAIVNVTSGGQVNNITTDANGAYQLLVESGQATIEVSAALYRTVTVTSNLVAGKQIQFSPLLLLLSETPPSTSTLFGTVVDKQGESVVGALVSLLGGVTITTDANGKFEFTGLSQGEVEITISKDGFESIALQTVIPDRSNANIGTVTLNEKQILPSTRVSGRVIDMVSGSGVPAASVSIAGQSTTTDTNGFYQVTDIPILEFTVSVNASGYLFSNKQVSLAEHAAVNLDVNIRQADLGGVNIAAISTDKTSYNAYDSVIISATVRNDTALSQGTRLYVNVKNEAGVEVANFPGAFLPPLDPNSSVEEVEHYQSHLAATVEQFAPAEERTIQLEQWWNTLIVEPGNYTVTVQALDSITSNLVSEKSTLVTVLPTTLVNLDVKTSPSYVLLNGNADIEISAELLNRSNTSMDIAFDYRLLDPSNQVLTQGNAQLSLSPEKRNQKIPLLAFPYNFTASGNYHIEVLNITGSNIGELKEGSVFVPPSIRLRTTQSLQPNEVVPLEGVQVDSNIQVEGVDGE